MTWLSLLLLFKIACTLLGAAGPMLVFPRERVSGVLGVGVEAVPIVRLYGMALLALLVGYASGIPAAEAGVFPGGVVAMGIVSNAGATALLLGTGAWRRTPMAAPVFGLIALGLVAAAVVPAASLQRAW
jgi:hypothetical protein